MKRGLILLLVVLLLGVAGCQKDELVCEYDEAYVDGRCIELTPDRLALIHAIDSTKDLTNYRIEVVIRRGDATYEMLLSVDDNNRSFAMDGKTDYFVSSSDGCLHYVPTSDGYMVESVSCLDDPADPYGFFHSFQSIWFATVGDQYFMNIQHHGVLSAFFQNMLPDATVTNFVLTIHDGYLHQFFFDVNVEDAVWQFEMTLIDIEQVTLVLPEGGAS